MLSIFRILAIILQTDGRNRRILILLPGAARSTGIVVRVFVRLLGPVDDRRHDLRLPRLGW